MAKNKYIQERDFEKQSRIRWRGKLWFQLLIFLLYLVMGVVAALLVGTLINVIWYLIVCGWDWIASYSNMAQYGPGWSPTYLKGLIRQAMTGQSIRSNSIWVTLIMVATFVLAAIKGVSRWWNWTQLFSDRTLNFNRFASLKEIDQTYKLVPDRNAFYKGNAGLPVAHISGYRLEFAALHPLLWSKQLLTGLLGLNQETFPKWYQWLRRKFLDQYPPRNEKIMTVKGGYHGFYYIDDQPTHEEILGATRAGKDQRYGYISIDIIRRSEFQPNIIDTDAKNEDAKMSFKPLRAAGYEVQLLNIQDVDVSESWNPLEAALSYAQEGEWDKARDEAEVVVQILGNGGSTNAEGQGDKIWDNTAQQLQLSIILILLWLAMENDDPSLVTPTSIVQFSNSMRAFSDPENTDLDGLTQYFNLLSQLDPMPPIINQALNSAGAFLKSSGPTKTSVMFTLDSLTALFTSETVARLTSQSTIYASDYGFSRLMKFQFDVDIFAGATVNIRLVNSDTSEVLDEDSMKVSRAGVVKCPFKTNFPTNWEIQISFADQGNPPHLRDSVALISGIRRVKIGLDGKPKVDVYSQLPEIEIIPERQQSQLFEDSSFTYTLRYSEKPAAVFIIIPQNNDKYAALGSLFLGQVFSVNTEISSEITRRKMDRRTIYKLNEFSIWPRIPGFDSFLTRGLTYGHIVNIYVQDHSQYEKKYTAQEAKEIKNQMLFSVYILSKDKDTNKELSDTLGEIEIQKESANYQAGYDRQNKGNVQASVERRPLMSPKEISELLDSEMIVTRTAKRNDKKYHKVRALPIFDTGITAMPNSRDIIGQSYRLDYYTTDLRLKNKNQHLSYDDLFKDFKPYFYQLVNQINQQNGVQSTETTDLFSDNVSENVDMFNNQQSIDKGQNLPTSVVQDELRRTEWQKAYPEQLDAPFADWELLEIPDAKDKIEHLMHKLLSREYYSKRSAVRVSSLDALARGDFFGTYPDRNTRYFLMNIMDTNWDDIWEVADLIEKQKDLYGIVDTQENAAEDVYETSEYDENTEF